MDSEKIGKFIANLRKENNLSQLELAEKINISNKAISKWETGKGIPDSASLIELSKFFNISINEILLGERKNKNNQKELEQVPTIILKDNKKRIRKITSLSLIIFSILIIIFLGYYFINTYNSISVYKISGENEEYKISDGILIFSNDKAYIKLGKLSSNRPLYQSFLYYIKDDYFDTNNQERILYRFNENDFNELIVNKFYDEDEFIRTEEHFPYEDIKYIKKNLYLELTFNDHSKIKIPLKLEKDFSNNKLFKIKRK